MKLNAKTGKQYRLPSYDEWNYACAAGSLHHYCGSDNYASVAKLPENGIWTYSKPYSVASYQPNAFGLYDMTGNVAEMTGDKGFTGGSHHSDVPLFSGYDSGGEYWERGLRLAMTLDKDVAKKPAATPPAKPEPEQAKKPNGELKMTITTNEAELAAKAAAEKKFAQEQKAQAAADLAEKKAEAAKLAAANAAREEKQKAWCMADQARLGRCACTKYNPVKGGACEK